MGKIGLMTFAIALLPNGSGYADAIAGGGFAAAK
jgi:hypothetical protein